MNETRKNIPQTLPNGKVVIKPMLKWGPRFENRKASVTQIRASQNNG